MNAGLLIVATGVVAAFATWLVRRYAIRAALIDIPNERSSHSVPTPRGGGIGILAGVVVGLFGAYAMSWLERSLFSALLVGGSLVAAIGFIDDHRHVPARVRASVHLIAALVALMLVGGLPVLRFGSGELSLGIGGWILGSIGIVWSINLYNFMDGIDGIAASEAVVVCGAGAVLASLLGATSVSITSAIIAAGAAGFLLWNWAPAKIFMGDVGSGLLGYCIAVVGVASENTGGPSLIVWLVLGAAFFVDATLTLVRRVIHGEKWFQAHRLHAYQRAVQAGWSHGAVSGAVVGLGLMSAGGTYLMVADMRRASMASFGVLMIVLGVYLAIERVQPMYPSTGRERMGSSP